MDVTLPLWSSCHVLSEGAIWQRKNATANEIVPMARTNQIVIFSKLITIRLKVIFIEKVLMMTIFKRK